MIRVGRWWFLALHSLLAANLVVVARIGGSPASTMGTNFASASEHLYVSETSGMLALCYAEDAAAPQRIVWSRHGHPVAVELSTSTAVGYTSWDSGIALAASLEHTIVEGGYSLVACPPPYMRVRFISDGTVVAFTDGFDGVVWQQAMSAAFPHRLEADGTLGGGLRDVIVFSGACSATATLPLCACVLCLAVAVMLLSTPPA